MTQTDTSEKPRRVPMIPGPRTNLSPHTPDKPGHRIVRDSGDQVPATREPEPLRVANIARAISDVMANVGTIEQRGINKFHNYKYMLMGDLLFALTPLMGKHGLAVFQNEIEIKTVETRVAVTYEFTVVHESGEIWPGMRFTGMSNARDSKGGWDDKAINKCHTAARKYFLL